METTMPARSMFPKGRIGFTSLSRPLHYASEQFVEDLLYALVALGVNRLFVRGELNRRLNLALGKIHGHCLKMVNHYRKKGRMERAKAFLHIGYAVAPSSIGALDNFWGSTAHCSGLSCWRTDGVYVLQISETYANHHVQQLEPDYASLVSGYAKLIKRSLDGRC